jgi:uncharacterized coiled-coil protein SlyX
VAKLIKILAASIGGGMALGYSVRALSESKTRNSQPEDPRQPELELDNRLTALERRLWRLEENRHFSAPGAETQQFGASLREDVERQVERVLDDRVGELEERLRSATSRLSEEIRTQTTEAVKLETARAVERGLAGAVDSRFAKLEANVASQSAALQDLRECSLQTERSVQRLLAGIDRLVTAQERARQNGPQLEPEPISSTRRAG